MNINKALQDLTYYKLHRVGRKHMTAEELWLSWINEN